MHEACAKIVLTARRPQSSGLPQESLNCMRRFSDIFCLQTICQKNHHFLKISEYLSIYCHLDRSTINVSHFITLGLLIEPSLDYEQLLKRNRKIISINSCISMDNSPHVMEFLNYGALGGIKGKIAQEIFPYFFYLINNL